ncbi:MAG: hypothetical protein K1W22_15665 [Lachnospiraceae bacterium]
MLIKVLRGRADMDTLIEMKELAVMIRDSADCAIGYQSAIEVLEGLETFKEDYISHIRRQECTGITGQKIQCVTLCPAPSYGGISHARLDSEEGGGGYLYRTVSYGADSREASDGGGD